jgi:hypothetical protein
VTDVLVTPLSEHLFSSMKQIDHLFDDLDTIYLDSLKNIKTTNESANHVANEIQDLELLFKEHEVRANRPFRHFVVPSKL